MSTLYSPVRSTKLNVRGNVHVWAMSCFSSNVRQMQRQQSVRKVFLFVRNLLRKFKNIVVLTITKCRT